MRKVPSASSFRDIFSTVSQDVPARPVESLLTFLGFTVGFLEPSGLSALPGPSPAPYLEQVRFAPQAGCASPLGRGAGLVVLPAAHLAVGPKSLP